MIRRFFLLIQDILLPFLYATLSIIGIRLFFQYFFEYSMSDETFFLALLTGGVMWVIFDNAKKFRISTVAIMYAGLYATILVFFALIERGWSVSNSWGVVIAFILLGIQVGYETKRRQWAQRYKEALHDLHKKSLE